MKESVLCRTSSTEACFLRILPLAVQLESIGDGKGQVGKGQGRREEARGREGEDKQWPK